MKKLKELKGRIAALLIVSMVAVNMTPAAFGAVGAVFQKSMKVQEVEALKLSLESARMRIGGEQALTVEYVYNKATGDAPAGTGGEIIATGPEIPASPAELELTWESSEEEVATVNGNKMSAMVKAVKEGVTTITVSTTLPNKKVVKNTCKITVVRDVFTADLNVSKIDYDGTARLDLKLKQIDGMEPLSDGGDSFDVTDYDTNALSIDRIEGSTSEKASYTITPINAKSGKFEFVASVNVGGAEPLTQTMTLEVNDPTLTLKSDKKEIDVKGKETAILTAGSNCEEFIYFWDVTEGEELVNVTGNGRQTAAVTPLKAGTAKVRVTAEITNSKIGPSPEIKDRSSGVFTKEVTIIVNDTRTITAEPKYVVLDINPKAEIRSNKFEVINDFGGELTYSLADPTDSITVTRDKNIFTVSTTAIKTGSAVITVIDVANGKELPVPITILTSGELPVIKNDVEILPPAEEIFNKEVEEDTSEEVDTELNLPENAEVKQEIETKKAEQKQEITDSIKQSISDVSDKPEIKELLAGKVNVAANIARDFGNVQNGETVTVYPKQELSDVAMKSVVVKNAEGKFEVKTVITEMRFDISLFMDRITEDGQTMLEKGFPLGEEMKDKGNTKLVSIPVPLPATGIEETATYAIVSHLDANTNDVLDVQSVRIQNAKGCKYIVISANHFSPFIFKFSDKPHDYKAPTGSSSSSGGRGGSSSISAKWLQDANGWLYKDENGVRLSNTWKAIQWNNITQWYRFNPDGYMASGWFTDLDGSKYFLHNISDGSQGKMYTGWNIIEGKWYYFQEFTGAPYGSLLVNGVTPDGYTIGADGTCPQFPGIQK